MKLKAGKRYRYRNGEVSEPLKKEGPYLTAGDFLYSNNEETGWRVFSFREHDYDLMEEVKE